VWTWIWLLAWPIMLAVKVLFWFLVLAALIGGIGWLLYRKFG
jgi:hypothetical protein